ncbi:MAG TPA: hypothetical protein VGJ00_02225 [Rhabdochlamydiaceae bacterium]
MHTFDKALFEKHVQTFAAPAVDVFKQITRHYALFHISFFLIGLIELFAFILFFSFFTRSAIFAVTIAGLFFTGFAYFVLLFYFQAKKPQQLLELRNAFAAQCKTAVPFKEGEHAYHTAHIHALYHLFSQFHRHEYSYYPLPENWKTLSLLTKKFSVWTYWKDVLNIKEILLLMIIQEYVALVKLKPSDLEVHSGLATAFGALAKLYMDPRKSAPEEEHLWVSPEYHSAAMRAKFEKAAHCTIEELRILDTYAPNDPWVHFHLASIYKDLAWVDKEIEEYEAILSLAPKDQEILFRLGVLYFSQGRNAHALALYEKLKESAPAKAEELLGHYGAAFVDLESEFACV